MCFFISVQKPEDYLIVSCDGDPTVPEGSVLPPIAPDASVLPPKSYNDTSAEVVSQGQINLIPDMGIYPFFNINSTGCYYKTPF